MPDFLLLFGGRLPINNRVMNSGIVRLLWPRQRQNKPPLIRRIKSHLIAFDKKKTEKKKTRLKY